MLVESPGGGGAADRMNMALGSKEMMDLMSKGGGGRGVPSGAKTVSPVLVSIIWPFRLKVTCFGPSGK